MKGGGALALTKVTKGQHCSLSGNSLATRHCTCTCTALAESSLARLALELGVQAWSATGSKSVLGSLGYLLSTLGSSSARPPQAGRWLAL
jgi:hypothetical protein